jgi:protein SCO1/2
MKQLSKKGWLLFFLLALGIPVIAMGVLQWYKTNASALPYYGENYTIQPTSPYFTVPVYSFINQDSLPITNQFTDGKIWIAHYFYTTCPSICPKMIAGVTDIQKEYSENENVRIVSFTVNPETDTPKKLKEYAIYKKIDSKQWQLATGEKKLLYRFARKGLSIVASDGDGGPDDFIHSEKLVLIDQQNHIRGYYDGTEPKDIQQLIKDIRRLLNG